MDDPYAAVPAGILLADLPASVRGAVVHGYELPSFKCLSVPGLLPDNGVHGLCHIVLYLIDRHDDGDLYLLIAYMRIVFICIVFMHIFFNAVCGFFRIFRFHYLNRL